MSDQEPDVVVEIKSQVAAERVVIDDLGRKILDKHLKRQLKSALQHLNDAEKMDLRYAEVARSEGRFQDERVWLDRAFEDLAKAIKVREFVDAIIAKSGLDAESAG